MPLAISSIVARTVEIGLADGLRTSRHEAGASQTYLLVRLGLSDGTEGYGEAPEGLFITGESGDSMLAAVNRHFAPLLIGRDPFDRESIQAAMVKELPAGNASARSAVDLALHDALGRHLGLPVSRLLGGAPRGPVASSKAVGTGPVETMVADARRHQAAGHRTVKIKTGVDAEAELGAIRAIREAFGPALNIKIDANQGWTYTEAVAFLDRVAKYDIQMVEQPLAASDLEGHAELRRRIAMPLMLDESVHGPDDALRAIETGACDYINIKLMKAGGLTPAVAIADICRAGGIACQIGSLSTGIGTAAAIHLIHARSIMRFAEVNWPVRLARDVGTGFRLVDGAADVAATPGLGITVDADLFRAAA